MSNEISMFEKLGGTYTEVDGIWYPNIGMDDTDTKSDMDLVVTSVDIGKYGHLWISYMKENHLDRYRHHLRMNQLHIKAREVNEEAYEMLEGIVNQYLVKHKPQNSASTMEMWRLREQAKQMAEEVVLNDIVRQYY